MEIELNLNDSHPFLSSSNDLNEICKPLFESSDINYFLYSKIFRDSRCIWLCTNSNWLKHFCDMKYYNIGTFEQSIDQYVSGMYLWSGVYNNVLQDAKQNFDIDNGVTLIDNSIDFCEFYHFASSRNNQSINDFYINNPDLLKRFIFYFKEKADALIQQASKNSIVLPMPIKIEPLIGAKIESQHALKNLYDRISCKTYHLNSKYNNAMLTKKEVECLFWLCQGKSSEEISLILSISTPTVLNNIDIIKNKTMVQSSLKLTEIASELGILIMPP